MSRWRFVLSPRWAGYFSLVLVFSIASCMLGVWQFERRAEAHAEVVRIESNFDAAPKPLGDILPTLDFYSASLKWHPVTVSGTYLIDEQLLVRGRSLNGSPGFEVLTPLRLSNGTVFIIDRGWVPGGNTQDEPDQVPAPPIGQVTVVARLKPSESAIPGRGAPAGQVATIELAHISSAMISLPMYTGAYGLLASEQPAPVERLATLPKPPLDEGPHLSYALQWFVFALLAYIGLAWALRQEYRLVNSADPAERERAKLRQRRKAQKSPTDSEVEDSILDGG